tara:strand:- start:609 stop:794 length:186 start_codon:yes stop_codon:yes gene_type:complete
VALTDYVLTKGLDKRGFTDPRRARDANTDTVPGMGQEVLQQRLRGVSVSITLTFDQCDGFR